MHFFFYNKEVQRGEDTQVDADVSPASHIRHVEQDEIDDEFFSENQEF